MIVMESANNYTGHWYLASPSQNFSSKVLFFVLDRLPSLGYIYINEDNSIIKAFDKNMDLLKAWEIK